GDLQRADEPLAFAVDLLDRPLEGLDLLLALLVGLPVERLQAAVQQTAAILAEDLGGEEVGHSVNKLVFTHPVGRGRVSFRQPSLLGRADIVGVAALGLAVHATAAERAEEVAA